MLPSSQLLSGLVSSVEDHGYLIDVGLSGTKAFLPRQKAQDYLKSPNKGKVELCVVKLKVGNRDGLEPFTSGLLMQTQLRSARPTVPASSWWFSGI